MDDDYKRRLEKNRQEAEERTIKKRQKRLKKKQKKKSNELKPNQYKEGESEEENEEGEKEEDDSFTCEKDEKDAQKPYKACEKTEVMPPTLPDLTESIDLANKRSNVVDSDSGPIESSQKKQMQNI